MNRFLTFCLIVIGLSFSKNTIAQSPDTLQLRSGQILLGAFLGWHNDDISFYIFDAGVVNVDRQKVSMLKANSSKYRIETSIRKIFYDHISCVKPGEFVFMENGNPITVDFKNIEIITPYKNGGSTEGHLGLGYNYSQSNDFGLFAIDGGISFTSQKWMIEGDAKSGVVYTKAKSLLRNRESAKFSGNRTLNAHWQFASRYVYQRNVELGLAYRHLLGAGFVYNLVMKPNFHMNLTSGFAVTTEKTYDDQKYNRYEIPILLDVNVYKLGSSNLSLKHTQSLFIGVGSNKRVRHDGELNLNMRLTKKLSFTTYLYDEYDSAPVQKTGTDQFDFGWNTGLRLGF